MRRPALSRVGLHQEGDLTMTGITKGLSLTSSAIVVAGLGLKPQGVASAVEAVCTMCGVQIGVGDIATQASFSQGFTDDLSLAARGSPCVCGDCATLTTVDALRASGFGVFTRTQALPFRKWGDIAAALLNPPEPPFVMCYSTANSQHMAWRSIVNLSRDAFYVRVGLRDLLIRAQVLRQAVSACELLGNLPGVKSKSTAARKTLPNPFTLLSSDLKEAGHGRLHPGLFSDAARQAWTPEHDQALRLVRNLTLGETWALRFVLTPGAGQPQQ